MKKLNFKHNKMVIDVNALQMNARKFTTSEIGRGIGVHSKKKGNGSYTRKSKHKEVRAVYLYEPYTGICLI